jgi:hypothetical protein
MNRSHFVMLFIGLVIGLLLNFWNVGAIETKAESNSEKNYVTLLVNSCTPESKKVVINSFQFRSNLIPVVLNKQDKRVSTPVVLKQVPEVELTPVPTQEIPEVSNTPEPTEIPDDNEKECKNDRDNYNSQGNHNCSDNNPSPNSNQERNKNTD